MDLYIYLTERLEYDLFVIQSLRQFNEKKGILQLRSLFQELIFFEAEDYLKEELRIDIKIIKENNIIAGIQIKPFTFLKLHAGVVSFNHNANKK